MRCRYSTGIFALVSLLLVLVTTTIFQFSPKHPAQATQTNDPSQYLPLIIGEDPADSTRTPHATSRATLSPTPRPTIRPTTRTTAIPSPTHSSQDVTLIAAGDVVKCGRPGSALTADIVKGIPGTVAMLGDSTEDVGALIEYQTCYDPTWGQFKNRTKPVPDNHDYLTSGAAGYYVYFGSAAGSPLKGYYSYDLGAWHILAINSNCQDVGSCHADTDQETWVRQDLAAHPAKCTLAYWHHPYFSSGKNGEYIMMDDIWQDLYAAGAELVLSGHDHDYERFAPQDVTGKLDRKNGIVQFVVGVGGSNFTPLQPTLLPNSAASEEGIFGVLKLTLHPDSYTWEFISVDGSYTDTGTVKCH